MFNRNGLFAALLIYALLVIFLTGHAETRDRTFEVRDKLDPGPDRVLVVDGSNVHNIGELLMHVGNWGIFGSMPSTTVPFSHAPSAEWPAGSGVEHLFVSGLWVGALKDGVPAVSTAAFEMEFWPTDDAIDSIYRASEGAPGGNRLPCPGADDDNDGLMDEDWLDGRDNDGDYLVDEDFAAISGQMFSCWFTDDQPVTGQIYSQHEPLHILVRQESYQWEDDRFDDFVGIRFWITNTGDDTLRNVYLGFFADCDVGSRNTSQYWMDDAAGSLFGAVCTDLGPAFLNMGYMYDHNADGGRSPGFIGVMLLGHTADPLGATAPRYVETNSFSVFFGDQPYENGGDPVNDFQRYELLSTSHIDANSGGPEDYRILISAGPFPEFSPGAVLEFYIGLVAGEGFAGLIDNAAHAQRLFDGTWYDLDGDAMTGVTGREAPVCGPAENVVVDECRPEPVTVDVPAGGIVRVNSDCAREAGFMDHCGYGEADSLVFRTGVAGRETQVHWIIGEVPPLEAALDIRPGSCPNPFNLKLFDFAAASKPKKGGVLPVAVLGSGDFNVQEIDISTVRLEGLAPLPQGRGYEDVSGPDGGAGCDCTTMGPDGHLDLALKFRSQEIAGALGSPEAAAGEERMLALTGKLLDGADFYAADCIKFVGTCGSSEEQGGRPKLLAVSPVPFNPATSVKYYLPDSRNVRLSVYDVSGRLIEVLAQGIKPAGEHVVEWNAGGLSSGVYFYLFEAGDYRVTRKVVLLR